MAYFILSMLTTLFDFLLLSSLIIYLTNYFFIPDTFNDQKRRAKIMLQIKKEAAQKN